VRTKRTPQLQFLYDESIDQGIRIETLLKRYEGELGPEPADGELPPEPADGEPLPDAADRARPDQT
jgi:hypothetical protein